MGILRKLNIVTPESLTNFAMGRVNSIIKSLESGQTAMQKEYDETVSKIESLAAQNRRRRVMIENTQRIIAGMKALVGE